MYGNSILGRTGTDEKEKQLINDFRQVNDEGKEDVLDYTNYAIDVPIKYFQNFIVSPAAGGVLYIHCTSQSMNINVQKPKPFSRTT